MTVAKEGTDDRIRYGGAWVSAASALPLNADAIRPRPVARLVAASVRRPRRLVALIALLLRTPTERVALSRGTTGQVLREYFTQRAMGVVPRKRFFRGMLVLPEDHMVYIAGRHRKAVRRNLRRAAADGIYCEVVSEQPRAFDDISEVLRDHPRSLTDPGFHTVVDRIHATAERPETTVIVARGQGDRAVAILTCVIDDEMCLITSAVAASRDPRWALHDYLVRLLIAQRVRYLLGDGEGPFGALGYPPSVQHYQHLLGYELRHVIPARTRRVPFRRRLVAAVVLAAATAAVAAPSAAAASVHLTTQHQTAVHRTTPHQTVQAADRLAEVR